MSFLKKCALKAKKYNKVFFLGAVCSSAPLLFLTKSSLNAIFPTLPTSKNPIVLYSNSEYTSLKHVVFTAIKRAKSSIYIHTFALSDKEILALLISKSLEGVSVSVLSDYKTTSPSSFGFELPFFWHTAKFSGLAHEKIMIIDEHITFLGTANLTTQSLCIHDNLIVGIYDKALATKLVDHFSDRVSRVKKHTHFHSQVEHTSLDMYFLPGSRHSALKALIDEIKQAKSSIRVAMFTFTHPDLIRALFEAKNKNEVSVEVFLDRNSRFGSSKNAYELLKANQVPTGIKGGNELLHHKIMLIDDCTLIVGSANWTKGAFNKNQDFFLILSPISKKNLSTLKTSFNKIKTKSMF